MTKQLKLGALILALVASTGAMAQEKPGYTTDGATGSVVRNAYGECWQNTYLDKEKNGLVECGDAKEAPVVVAPTYQNERISLSAKFLFGFDKATLRPQAIEQLNEVGQRLVNSNATLESVVVQGHTDFKGSDAYNNALSEKRANAVRDYLLSRGVSADKIQAVGLGKSQATMTEQCKEQVKSIKNKAKHRLALIDCIEPDRRVDILIRSVVQTQVK